MGGQPSDASTGIGNDVVTPASLPALKEATFVVLDASPLDDIRNTGLIHAVVRRGAVVDCDALRVR